MTLQLKKNRFFEKKQFWVCAIALMSIFPLLILFILDGIIDGVLIYFRALLLLPLSVLFIFSEDPTHSVMYTFTTLFYTIEIFYLIILFKSNKPKKYITASIIFILQIIISAIFAAVITLAYAS